MKPTDRAWAADLMAASEPWLTLGRADAMRLLKNPAKKCFLVRSSGERAGYETVGRLRDYIVPGHDEILLRKTLGPLLSVEGPVPAGPRPVRRRALQKSAR